MRFLFILILVSASSCAYLFPADYMRYHVKLQVEKDHGCCVCDVRLTPLGGSAYVQKFHVSACGKRLFYTCNKNKIDSIVTCFESDI